MKNIDLKRLYFILLVSATVLGCELLLTRLFSVIFFNQISFVIISLAMLGLAAGSVSHMKNIDPSLSPDSWREKLPGAIVGASLSGILALYFSTLLSNNSVAYLFIGYSIWIPCFFFLGKSLAILLFPTSNFGLLYFADLVGAAGVCFIIGSLIYHLGAPSAIGLFLLILSLSLIMIGKFKITKLLIPAVIIVMIFLDLGNHFLQPKTPKGREDNDKIIYLKWNSLSRIAIYDDYVKPWSIAPKYSGPKEKGLFLDIDASASTSIIDPSFQEGLNSLKFDLTSAVYRFSPKDLSLIIGSGGGRDVWAALTSGQNKVHAVEINPVIFKDVMQERYASLTKNLYLNHPQVNAFNQDGRAFLKSSKASYDTIHLSLVDTWAATTAGAFTHTESSLYTLEAFQDYLDHLSSQGLFSMIRWSDETTLRVIDMLFKAAKKLDIKDPQKHLIILKSGISIHSLENVIFSRNPITNEQMNHIRNYIDETGFKIVFHPQSSKLTDESYKSFHDVSKVSATLGLLERDYFTPTDDRPFFFYRPLKKYWQHLVDEPFAVFFESDYMVISLGIFTFFLSFIFLILPLRSAQTISGEVLIKFIPFASYFSLLGFGFMLIEIGLFQRFILFLGHPSYSLTCLLSGLLSGTGLGALFENYLLKESFKKSRYSIILLSVFLVTWIGLWAFFSPQVLGETQFRSLVERIVVTELFIVPLGFLLGIFLPIGMAKAKETNSKYQAWGWAMNGVFSVIGSCMAVFLSMNFGFTVVITLGAFIYVMAGLNWMSFKPN